MANKQKELVTVGIFNEKDGSLLMQRDKEYKHLEEKRFWRCLMVQNNFPIIQEIEEATGISISKDSMALRGEIAGLGKKGITTVTLMPVISKELLGEKDLEWFTPKKAYEHCEGKRLVIALKIIERSSPNPQFQKEARKLLAI